ncbi:phosphoribosyltransferase [Elizabethkingia anophelis]|uniref:Amidophosphoribosyltransferase n=1 Tax=Elizabethkingia anophelis TaxID=1117645 RepID=A0AAU8VBS8_9FLAO|nr:phosphoribosyltransferase [Elizabethkingia anophelis]AQX00106.1 hypothetical protein BBD32_00835 [Elizabethkingia anophelis]MCT3646696.1 amidophosphoribosyltransferase [Elizabethkingia anophelis]MCT3694453.1 amidophosphoribosyltransferase [Elizabethkingia anophelis]MCT3857682.1 amidophosphoribosyltransferase [Elizabethkingia anophelis]MCT3910993.1 amidophosphoribosyltransferase [Elizabethkingia anophelis]
MESFTIVGNNYLTKDISGFYHTDFGGFDMPGNPNFLYKLKNDPHHNWSAYRLEESQRELLQILLTDLPKILKEIDKDSLTVCVVPRSKAEASYNANQLLFKATVKHAVNRLGSEFIDGTNFVQRHTNTKTTHLRKPMEGFENDGHDPYPGISLKTCDFSDDIQGRNILLIDDIYTKTVNIDEDMIEAFLKRGAKSVTFYAIGHTI